MATGLTHVGRVRTNNEDSFCVERDIGLFLVADGLGGHACGEIASRMAVEIIQETYQKSLRGKSASLVGRRDPKLSVAANRLLGSIRLANRAIFELSQSERTYQGMGTTLVGLLAHKDHLIQVHVGDSRIYRLRAGEFQQTTEDHSLVLQQFRLGLLTEEEARASRAKNVITRALGIAEEVEVDVVQHEPLEDDTYLLCTDGLSDLVAPEQMREALVHGGTDLAASSKALVQLALDRGGQDNITVLLVRLGRRRGGGRRLRGALGRFIGRKRPNH